MKNEFLEHMTIKLELDMDCSLLFFWEDNSYAEKQHTVAGPVAHKIPELASRSDGVQIGVDYRMYVAIAMQTHIIANRVGRGAKNSDMI